MTTVTEDVSLPNLDLSDLVRRVVAVAAVSLGSMVAVAPSSSVARQ